MWESKIYEQMQESAVLQSNHATESHAQGGGKTCLYMYFGGAKALFSYMNLQVTTEGGKTMQNLSSGGMLFVSPSRYVPAPKTQSCSSSSLAAGLKYLADILLRF